MKHSILNELNNAQINAVQHVNGPSIILAGAGSGKTRVLTNKTVFMIEEKNISPPAILMVTFTNKAAGEMKKRIQIKITAPIGFVGTFHSLSASILRKDGYRINVPSNFVIFDEEDKETMIKKAIPEINFNGKINVSTLSYKISSAKDNLLDVDEYARFATNSYEEALTEGYRLYQKKLENSGGLDFDDLLFKTVLLLKKNPDILSKYNESFQYILVDEFQDTNTAQYELTRLLAGKKQNITVVGDFSQSIYSWRGAQIRNLEKFQNDFKGARVFYLEQNYRSTQKILNFAYDIIVHNTTHPILKLFTNNNEGDEVNVIQLDDENQEAIFIASKLASNTDVQLDDIAVLYRVNSQSRAIEEALLHYGVPYVLIGGTRFYARREVKDIISYLRLAINENDSVSRERAEKIGKRKLLKFQELVEQIKDKLFQISSDELIQKILDKTEYLDLYDPDNEEDYSRLENIKELRSVALSCPNINELLEQIALVESEYFEAEKKGSRHGVKMMTMHACKGLEFDKVFIVGVEEGLLPHARSLLDNHELEEERRLFYVALTRAKQKLYITHTRNRYMFGRRQPNAPSRFLSGQTQVYDY